MTKRRVPPNVRREPATASQRGADHCYLCGRPIDSTDRVARLHETTMHRDCYERDIRQGR
jgi:hypothetical protein